MAGKQNCGFENDGGIYFSQSPLSLTLSPKGEGEFHKIQPLKTQYNHADQLQIICQSIQVTDPLPECWDIQSESTTALIQIIRELFLPDQDRQVFAGRDDQSEAHFEGLDRAQPEDLVCFQNLQEF